MTNHQARNRNLATVFEAIREADAPSRTELMAGMPFTPQTMTNVCNELLALGLIAEGRRVKAGGKGKPRTALAIVPGRGHAVGVQIRWNQLKLCLVDLGFSESATEVFVPRQTRIEDFVEEIAEAIGDYVRRHEARGIWSVGVSAALPGGRSDAELAPAHPYAWADGLWYRALWKAFTPDGLRARIEAEAGLPTVLLNNPQAMALAEALVLPAEASFVYIMVGPGLGSAFITRRSLNTQVWRSAGELGFILQDGEPLGRTLSASGLRGHLGLTEAQGLYEPLIEAALADGDPRLDAWLGKSARLLRTVINFLENAMRPDGIRLGGFLPRPVLQALLVRTLPLDPSVVDPDDTPDRTVPRFAVATRSAESIALGAGAMTLSNHANPGFPDLVGALRARSS